MNIKKENGSMSIFVLVGLLFMTAFLIITYGSLSNKSKAIAEQYNVVKGIYSWSDDYLQDAHYNSISIGFDTEELMIPRGEKVNLVATIFNENEENVNWNIKDETIARIEQINGNIVTIEGIELGETTITAEYERKTKKIKIMVIIDPTDFTYTYNDNNKTATVTGLSEKGQGKIANEVATLTIPDTIIKEGEKYTITQIGANAFKDCTNLNLTNLPTGLTRIGNGAFNNCTSLALTSLPEGLTNIEANAFSSCTSLAITSFPEGVTTIIGGSFLNCTSLQELDFKNVENTTYNGSNCFGSCTNLKKVYATKMKVLGGWAFGRCTALEEVELGSMGNPVQSIAGSAFGYCTQGNLTIKVYIADGETSLANAPWGATNARIEFYNATNGELVNLIWGANYKGNTQIDWRTLPNADKITSIVANAFQGCTSLALTSLPEGLTNIGVNAFKGCTSLAITEIPEGVTAINDSFSNCTSLQELNLRNVENTSYYGEGCFIRCINLKKVYAPKIKVVAGWAFGGCTSLEEVELGSIGNAVQTIAASAFGNNTQSNLTIKIYIADGETSLANAPWGATNATIEYYNATTGAKIN